MMDNPQDQQDDTPQKKEAVPGLEDVLPLNAAMFEADEILPVPFSVEISEPQHKHIRLLERMLAQENEGTPPPAQPPKAEYHPDSFQRFLRLAIGLILILTITANILYSNRSPSAALAVPSEITQTRTILRGLSSESMVLVAFDYEPGFSGEMEPLAGVVFQDILASNAVPVILSTSPLGTLQAARLMQKIQPPTARQPFYLGYLPGGAAGLMSLTNSLRNTFPLDVDGESPWLPDGANPKLQAINSIADFAAVIVLSAEEENARNWLEQVQPALNKTPLIFVMSAQAAPLIRPYLSGNQLQGMIGGVIGAHAYQEPKQPNAMLQMTWDGFAAGVWVAVAFIVCGSGLSLVLLSDPARKKRRKQRQKRRLP
jgi:hypothetical protein